MPNQGPHLFKGALFRRQLSYRLVDLILALLKLLRKLKSLLEGSGIGTRRLGIELLGIGSLVQRGLVFLKLRDGALQALERLERLFSIEVLARLAQKFFLGTRQFPRLLSQLLEVAKSLVHLLALELYALEQLDNRIQLVESSALLSQCLDKLGRAEKRAYIVENSIQVGTLNSVGSFPHTAGIVGLARLDILRQALHPTPHILKNRLDIRLLFGEFNGNFQVLGNRPYTSEVQECADSTRQPPELGTTFLLNHFCGSSDAEFLARERVSSRRSI